MIYFANPCGSPAVRRAMAEGRLGYIDTPAQGNRRPASVSWIADNGCFSERWDAGRWWRWLEANAAGAATCRFAAAPDVVGDARATCRRSTPWLERIRGLGYPVALVAQDGLEDLVVPWSGIDALFVGGSTAWKIGRQARGLVAQGKDRGKWVHMGRVNSRRRWRYAEAIGCDSVDGTFLVYGPDANLPRLLSWGDQMPLFPPEAEPRPGRSGAGA